MKYILYSENYDVYASQIDSSFDDWLAWDSIDELNSHSFISLCQARALLSMERYIRHEDYDSDDSVIIISKKEARKHYIAFKKQRQQYDNYY